MKLIKVMVLTVAVSAQVQAKDYSPGECPVVGNTNSRIYHVGSGRSYANMLRENKQGDNRACFKNEVEAEKNGYRKAKR